MTMGAIFLFTFLQLVILDGIVESTYLDVSDLRLKDGSGPFEGRVEIQVDGVWGTVCDREFTMDEAAVICRTMDLQATYIQPGAYYGQGSGPIFVQEFNCNGYETDISQCTYEGNAICTHADDVGIICSECGNIAVRNGQPNSISTNGTVLTITCKEGYTTNYDTSVCENGAWSPSTLTCSGNVITDLRFVDGIGLADGRVEVLVNDTWGTLCGRYIYRNEAKVICHMQGFSGVYTYFYHQYYSNGYGRGTGPVHISNLDCTGDETHINNCTYSTDISCSHYYDFAVVCSDPRNFTDIRLVGGTGDYDGRVEVYSNGVWGTICDDYIDNDDLQTTCRMLNLSFTHQFTSTVYGEGVNPILMGRLSCNGDETTLNDCSYYPPIKQNCNHDDDLTLICTECGEINNDIHGTFESINGSEVTVKCERGYRPDRYKMLCLKNGTWSRNHSCSLGLDYPLNITDVRLMYGYNSHQIPTEGLVELLVNGTWGTICSKHINNMDASVICHMLELEIDRFYTHNRAYRQNHGPVYIENLNCTGSESHVNECSYDVGSSCTHADDLAVICTGYQLNITDIRLAGTSGPYQGRVELEVNGTWGTVGHDYFSFIETQVICRMLGLEYRTYHTGALFGQGSGPIYVDRLDCPHSASHINQCTYSVNNYYNTQHDEDISVTCWGPPLNITDVRLVNGTSINEGRVEIKANDTWSTICGRSFDTTSANLICNILGQNLTRDAHYYTNAHNGEGIGPILIDELHCNGNEQELSSCRYLYLNECTHDMDVSVDCELHLLNITDIRLAGTSGPYQGRVELEVNGIWGTVGSDDFFSYEAQVICRMLGLEYRTLYWNAYFGQGSGPIHVDRLDCPYLASHINQCTYSVNNYYNTQHNKDVSVSCWGPPLNITDVRLVNGTNINEGRVEIKVNDTWSTICGRNFDTTYANLICKILGQNLTLDAHYYTGAYYGEGSGPIVIDELHCYGNEQELSSCRYLYLNECTHDRDVSVDCNVHLLNITDIRLAGTSGPYKGRVELEVNGIWGTVGSDYFYRYEAQVICRMLGLEYRTLYRNAYFGQGSGPIHVDRLNCPYLASHINQCTYSVNNYYNTQHNEDVSVSCWGPPLNITDIRLMDGTSINDGRVEIKIYDTWSTICDRSFDIYSANLICNMLGLRASQFYIGAYYGEGSGPILIDELLCNGNEQELSSCRYLYLNECTHDMDVSVVCNECGQPDIYYWDIGYFRYNGSILYADCTYYRTYIGTLQLTCDNNTQSWIKEGECQEYSYPLNITDIRLVGGTRATSGKVEIKSLDTWGTICSDRFGITEANVICNMIGYPHAVDFYSSAIYGEGVGPIFVDELNCVDNSSSHINDCSYVTYDDCTHQRDVSVVCLECEDVIIENGFVNSTATNYEAVIKIACAYSYKLIGDFVITCQINGSWSNPNTKCLLIDCGDPVPENGFGNTSTTINGTVVSIECEEGYELVGDNIIVCQENETWTDLPICQIKDCGLPSILNGEVNLLNNKTTFGKTVTVNCMTGYKLNGSSSITCNSNGMWEDMPCCYIVDCRDPTPIKGFVKTNETTFGTVVEVTCQSGYNITGNSTIVCTEDGTWSDYPICDETDCGILSVSNGKISYSQDTYIESVASLECDDGYSITGSSKATCIDVGSRAAWNNSFYCAIQVCADPKPANGKVINTDASDVYVFQNYAELQCDVGYSIHGDSVITCDDGGVWSDNATCPLIDCGFLSAPINGYIYDNQGTNYNAEILFSCRAGYLLDGAEFTKCEESGYWNNEPPKCVEKSGLGGHCENKDYCLQDGALCVNNVCTCSSGIVDTRTDKCDTMPLMPFGAANGDSVIPKRSICGPKVTFQPGFPIKNKFHTDLYVCRFGYISFDLTFQNPTPPKDRGFVRRERMLLAPFYGPIHIHKSGPVSYKTYDILNSYNEMKDNMDIVSDIEMYVRQFGSLDSFNASFIVIATWEKTVTYAHGFDSSKTSTFQVVLVSDGKVTYSIFIYGSGMMNWEYNLSTPPPVWIGNSLHSVIYTHPYSFTKKALKLDIMSSATISTKEVSGLLFRSLNDPGIVPKNFATDCINWYNQNFEHKKDLDYFASLLPECPCDIKLSRFDPWFWKIGLYRRRYDLDYKCVDMLPMGNFGQYGKSCCYDLRSSLLIYERPLAGSFHLYNWQYPTNHFINDLDPKSKCCSSSKYCNLYYELRPSGRCYRRSPYSFGAFWGDPHFSTLDGMNFTFNGLGEYTLLKIRSENCSFDLQARTERPLKLNGSLADATVFTAFAAKDLTSSAHIERNKNHTGLNIYGKEVDLTDQFYESTDEMEPFDWSSNDGKLSISKRNDSVNVYFPSCDISLSISLSVEMLTLRTSVPSKLKHSTLGLLGNYNDNISDDFTMPNGTVLMSNITEREIFEYGRTWEIDPNESAFWYDVGKSHNDFHNDSYVPRFLDEIDDTVKEKAIETCKDPNDIECIFDFAFTENAKIAEETNMIKGNLNADKKEIDEAVPFLEGCPTLNVTLGKKSECKLKHEVTDTLQLVSKTIGAEIDQEESTVSIVPSTSDPFSISVEAFNENGRKSPHFVFNILMCTGCNNNGVCTGSVRTDAREKEYFHFYTCECFQGYEGIDCENIFDGCSASPCSLDRICTSLTPEEQQNTNSSFKCAPCPEGYLDDGGNDCTDKDECYSDNGGCDQQCINTEGSFECLCYDGYKQRSDDKYKCTDINECEDLLHNCSHLCNNTVGGFACQCYNGYEYDGTSCLQTSDGGCSDECDLAHGCFVNDNNVPECFCNNGYEIDGSGKQCLDIDECSTNVCPQDCENTDGSFRCSCFTGYRLEGTSTCLECESTFWGDNCEQECLCNGRGASSCHPIKGCLCESGWHGDDCDEDINECDLKVVDPCNDPKKICVNDLGSYHCDCRTGYFLTDQGLCSDIDECLEPHLNNCTQECINTIESYSCGCKNGYTKTDQVSCEDINECELGTSECEQLCVNNQGQYSCHCYYGYTLNDDRRTCSKIEDPCLSYYNLTCSHFCMLINHNAGCGCQTGYILEQDNQTCTDVDECNDIEKNKCDEDATCGNTQGSFFCQCPIGKQLENDGRTCTDCDAYHYGQDCTQTCSCLNGMCDKKTGCICDPGWAGNNCETDIDECSTGNVNCLQQHSTCVNVLGSAFCLCDIGYQNISGICQDINECLDDSLNECDQICTNTEGTFTCSCHSGFIFNETCTDIDECSGSHTCDQVCENSIGSYKCSCSEGYRLDLSNRKTCIPLNECSVEQRGNCTNGSTCSIQDGMVQCRCLKGYRKVDDECQDVNECYEYNLCSQNCSNTPGSFICNCNVGFTLLSDKVTCKECDMWKFVSNCESDCSCNKNFTETCDSVTGECVCRTGIEGDKCEIDLDECVNDPICPSNSYCNNTFGSFTCNCLEGFFKSGSNDCEECDFRHFGSSCQDECQCNFENTDNCNHITGDCVCKQGWGGETCSDDMDECINYPNICLSKQWSTCVDYDGSYTCNCNDGFTEQPNNTCEDIDECKDEILNDCEQECVNIPGSFTCTCKDGYAIENKTCRDCIDDSYGYNCSKKCDCDEQNTKTCNRVNGNCLCKEGWNGEVCLDDIDECEDEDVCNHKANSNCNNTHGSYICVCEKGFREQNNTCYECLGGTHGHNCSENCICDEQNTKTCDHITGYCTCNEGWEGKNCSTDVNECEYENECREKAHSNCNNTMGSYICVCEKGYEDRINTCKKCQTWTYGYNCSSTCSCIQSNTESCDSISGECICIQGWTGMNCETDINECLNKTVCPPNSSCNNNEGGFDCSCNIGYTKTVNGSCEQCLTWTYGYNCSSTCSCNQSNTDSCDSISGECICIQGLTGINCETDINECLNVTVCPPSSSCNNSEGSFDCICYIGFTKTANNSCEKCLDGTYGYNCSENCTCDERNTKTCDHVAGKCTCREGWEGDICSTDVDECKYEHVCDVKANSNCNNTIGSYICVCEAGYQDRNNTCHECQQWSYGYECSSSCSCHKSNTETCDSRTGQCICKDGWNGTNCDIDINECLNETVCSPNSRCNNTEGGFDCTCNIGYTKSVKETCEICIDGSYGLNCTAICDCEQQNTKTCDHITGICTCFQGWKGVTCSVDIDECEINSTLCESKINSSCHNTNGSYDCNCNEGFREQGDSCTDCDEWTYGIDCQFNCTCNVTLAEYCDATDGICNCKEGWGGEKCEDDIDECMDNNICQENSKCINSLGTFSCICIDGFFLNESKACQDINECTNKTLNDCEQLCVNIPGSFTCTCQEGYTVQNTTCIECIDGNYGQNCSEKCVCDDQHTKTCDHVTGNCTCKEGWEGDICSIDKDECKFEHLCKEKENSYCNNTEGSYNCVCENGYRDKNITCEECEQWTYGYACLSSCSCIQFNTETCDSKTGECNCNAGWNGSNCDTDVNECLNETICPANSSCNNTDGSFDCICNIGFTKMIDDSCKQCIDEKYGDNCSKKCDCDKQNTETCNHVNGNCTCKEGWEGDTCSIDIDECKYEDACKQKLNSHCNNTLGSFTCICDNGYQEENNSCHECQRWIYGYNCSSSCSCNQLNTESCDTRSGQCICKDGWNGTNCETDINECLNETVCPRNSSCNNTEGSFDCVCNIGYTKVVNGTCEVCQEGTYGFACHSMCECDQHNTKVCDHIDGSCTCNQEWKGITCTVDIDECEMNSSLCESKINSSCHNTNGSYDCNCNEGFREQGNSCTDCDEWKYGKDCQFSCTCNKTSSEYCDAINGTCKCKDGWNGEKCEADINECTDNNICPVNSKCTNYLGTFECVCLNGFVLDGSNNCSECLQWTYGINCQSNCSCNKSFTDSCDAKSGQCICIAGRNGTNCEDDVDECIDEATCPPQSTCTNTDGDFNCTCNIGFKKTIDEMCEVCGNNTYGSNCLASCECVPENSASENQTCDTVTGQCKCGSNWEGETCDMDFNECSNDSGICSHLENTVCVNTFGSYMCDCAKGFVNSDEGICIEDEIKATIKPASGIWIEASVVIDIELPVETNLHASSVYNDTQNKLVKMLLDYFRTFTESVLEVIIIDIKKGSIIADCIITSPSAESNIISQLAAGMIELGKGTQLSYAGRQVNASSDTFHDQDPCQIFSSIGGGCGEEFSCTVDNGFPVCSSESDHQKGNWDLIIGLSAAVLFLLIVLALVAVSFRLIRRRLKNKGRLPERPVISEAYSNRHNDDGSDYYRNYTWQNGRVVDAGIRNDTNFKLPRFQSRSNLSSTFQSPFANHDTSSAIRKENWI